MRIAHAVLVSVLAHGVSACTAQDAARVTVSDSAGVIVVTNSIRDTAAVFSRATEALRIGSLDGPESETFGRIVDMDVAPDGTIYVLDQQARRVSAYGANGQFLRFIGGAGEGPGELSQWVNAVLAAPDGRVLVPDWTRSRINVFGRDGELAETIGIPPRPSGQSWKIGSDGTLLYRGESVSRGEDGRFEFWDAVLQLNLADPAHPDTLLILNYPQTEIGGPGNLRVPLIVNSAFWDRLDNGGFVWGDLEGREVRFHAADGRLERIVRSDAWRPRAARSSDHHALRELLRERLASVGGDTNAADGSNVVLPDSLPAITAVRGGPGGTVWVQRMGTIDAVDPMAVNARGSADALGGGEWDVLDQDGSFLGRVRLPARFRLFTISGGAVYGVLRDDFDVSSVARFRLEPTGISSR